jgi:hypothetical protein
MKVWAAVRRVSWACYNTCEPISCMHDVNYATAKQEYAVMDHKLPVVNI